MCIEVQTRYRRCMHTCLLRWDYCPILTPHQRQPNVGRACRRYKLRYKNSTDTTASCFECKLLEVAGWGVRSPTVSSFPERSPTMSSFFGGAGEGRGVRSPTFSAFAERSPTVSTLSSVGVIGGNRDRESKDSEISTTASEGLVSPGAKNDCRTSCDSKESKGKEEAIEEAKGHGFRGWLKRNFKAREGYEGAFEFQMADA